MRTYKKYFPFRLIILSFFFFSNISCSRKEGSLFAKSSLKIGGAFSLLSLNQYSLNSLGDSMIYSLLYDDVFRLSNKGISSKFLKNIKIKNQSISFDPVGENLFKDLKNAYDEGLVSALWSMHFKKFEFTKSKIKNLGKGSLSDLFIISSYFKLKGRKYGRYVLNDFIKNQRLKLLAKKENLNQPKEIIFYRTKSLGQGLKGLSANRLDIYINSDVINKSSLKTFKKLFFIKDDLKSVFLRLYKKQDAPHFLHQTIKKSKKQTSKLLTKEFKLEEEKLFKAEELNYKDLAVLFNSDQYQKILDIWSPLYSALSGKSLIYGGVSKAALNQRLVSGDFDYYLSLDIELIKKEIAYEAFHSRGKYNTYNVKSSELDLVLEKKKIEWNLSKRAYLNQKALKVLNSVPYISLEYKAPFYKAVAKTKAEYKVFKEVFNY